MPFLVIKIFKSLQFSSFLPNIVRLKEDVENGILMASWNDLHKWSIIIFWITQKPIGIKAQKFDQVSISELLHF